MDAHLRPLLDHPPAWLEAGGPEADVAVASRVRLARNLADTPFPDQLSAERAAEVVEAARRVLEEGAPTGHALRPDESSEAGREFLVERSLATRDLLQAARPTLVYFEQAGLAGVLVHEEDHFRIQGMAPGLALDAAAARARSLERRLRGAFRFAIHPRYGYLTSCPSNAGSGLRASVLLHLPALARLKAPLQRALHTARRSGLAVRGLHGEGSRALGRLYQISNQRTLGTPSLTQLQQVGEFAREVGRYERSTRDELRADPGKRGELAEDARRAHELLHESEALTTDQALELLSTLRLASLAGIEEEMPCAYEPQAVLQQMFQLQPGHLQARLGREMAPEERDRVRAELIRGALGSV